MKIEVKTIGGFVGDDPSMPVNTVKFFGAAGEYFGYWFITDRQPVNLYGEGYVLWTLTRGPWLRFRTWLRRLSV